MSYQILYDGDNTSLPRKGGCVRIKSTAACEAVGCYRDDKGNISFVGYYGPFLHCNNNSNCTAELHTSRYRPSPAAFPRVSYPDWDCHRRAMVPSTFFVSILQWQLKFPAEIQASIVLGAV